MKEKYIAPVAEIVAVESVNTLDSVSGDKEGSRVLLSWLIDD